MSRLEQLLSFQKDSPEDPFILFALAKEYEKQGEMSKAGSYYQNLAAEHPDYVGTYYHLGKWYEQQESFKLAFETYKSGIQVAIQQGDQHAKNELLAAKLNLGDDDDFEDE